MNHPHASTHQPHPSGPPRGPGRRARAAEEPEEGEFFPWLGTLWEGRVWIAGTLALFIVAGLAYTWWAPPVYQAECMLQLQAKKERPTDQSLAKMESLFAEAPDVHSEVEIIRSNLVLGRAIESLKLDIVVRPSLMPLIGAPLARRSGKVPAAKVEVFDLPTPARGLEFQLVAQPDHRYRWDGPDGTKLGVGTLGEPLTASYHGTPVKLLVASMAAEPGQSFTLVRRPLQDAIEGLRQDLDIAEKGKLTNILGLTLRGTDPRTCSTTLNQIVVEYSRHKIESRSGDMTKALDTLTGKMPELKARLEGAENRLNQFRSRSGSVDLSREADVYLSQSASLASQVSALQQKRQELLRTYTESADIVTTLDQQIGKLQQEMAQIDTRVRVLPGRQQEIVRLSRDVQVATELYTGLLNNIQQLQIAKAGELGNVVVVDAAAANPEPIAPKKPVAMLFFAFLGLASGSGVVTLRKALHQGIVDHRVIEAKLGLPVFVTIPHSKAQRSHDDTMRNSGEGLHLLATQDPGDLAVESLRSLRTMLSFYMKDAPNPIILISGSSPMIGKSFISANFAAVLAQGGAKVLLIDADLRRGKLHKYFGLKTRLLGLSDVLSGQRTWASVLQTTDIDGLHFMRTGLLPPNPSDLLMTARLSEFFDEVSKAYDYIIVDAPPILAVTDPAILAAGAGTVLLAAKFGMHPLDELRTAKSRFENHGVMVKGFIFNDIKPTGWGHNYSHYNYIYNYSFKE